MKAAIKMQGAKVALGLLGLMAMAWGNGCKTAIPPQKPAVAISTPLPEGEAKAKAEVAAMLAVFQDKLRSPMFSREKPYFEVCFLRVRGQHLSPQFLARFKNFRIPVRSISEAKQGPGGVVDPVTFGPGITYEISDMRWTSARTMTVECTEILGQGSGWTSRYLLQQRYGTWAIRKEEKLFLLCPPAQGG